MILKKVSAVLGFGLLLLWVFGLANPKVNTWINWLIGIGSIASFSISAFGSEHPAGRVRVGIPMGMSGFIFVLWLFAMFTGDAAWHKWWTFAFGCLYFSLGVVCAAERREPPAGYPTYFQQEREKKEEKRKIA